MLTGLVLCTFVMMGLVERARWGGGKHTLIIDIHISFFCLDGKMLQEPGSPTGDDDDGRRKEDKAETFERLHPKWVPGEVGIIH